MTNSLNLVIKFSAFEEPVFFTLLGKMTNNAGNVIKAWKRSIKLPKAIIYPNCLKGGASEKCIVRKPIAVVIAVINTGCKFTLKDSSIESFLFLPNLMLILWVLIIWTQWAIVKADNIKKELKVAAFKINFIQPATPIMPITERITIKAVIIDPKTDLNERPATKKITNNIKGVRVTISLIETSVKAIVRGTPPVT